MEQIGLIARVLESTIGRSDRVDQVLDRRRGRPLATAPMFQTGIDIPLERPRLGFDEFA